MKKIFIKIILIIFNFSIISITINPQASLNTITDEDVIKPIVILKNYDYQTLLEYPGYELISSNLNEKVVGNYINVYQSYQTKIKLTKPIMVVDKEDLEKGFDYQEETKLVHEGKIMCYLKLNDGSLVVASSKKNPDDTTDLLLSRTNGDETIWKITLRSECYGTIVDLIYDNDTIVGLSNLFFPLSGMDHYVFKVSLDGKIIKQNFFGGTGTDTPKYICKHEDSYLIAGHTTSEKGEISGKREKEDSYIVELDTESLKQKDVYYFNELYNDSIMGIEIDKDYIYVIQSFIYENNGLLPAIKVLKLNNNKEIVKEKIINIGLSSNVINTYYNESLYIVLVQDDYQTSKTQTIIIEQNKDLDIINRNIEEYDKILYVTDCYFDSKQISLLYKYNDSNNYHLKSYSLENYIKNIDFIIEEPTTKQINLFDVTTTIDQDNNNIIKHHLIKVDNFGSDTVLEKDTNIKDYQVKFNNENWEINDNLSTLNYNLDLFGNYLCTYYFNNETVDLIYQQNINVKSNPTIKNNGIYDLNLILKFNGQGLLNDKPIKTDYIIKDIGKYNLKIYGLDQKYEEYNFEIKQLSLQMNPPHKGIINNDYLEAIKNDQINKINDNITSIEINNEAVINQPKSLPTNLWTIFIPISLIGISLWILLRGGY